MIAQGNWVAGLAMSLAMVAVIALVWGGLFLIRRGGPERQRGVLMLVAAAVTLANVLIWTV